jgi:hypothetical protein
MAKRAKRTVQQPRLDPKRNIVPDQPDPRDRPYLPTVLAPPTSRCCRSSSFRCSTSSGRTPHGFALATVVNFLFRRYRDRARPRCPLILYSMARRYDEFPDPPKAHLETKPRPEEDTGSSLRGAMKGWYKHGVCRFDLWRGPDMPPPARRPEDDWWLDAARRPLGAYYRVDTRSATDMHVALHDVGILYASVVCHSGWLEGNRAAGGKKIWTIPRAEVQPDDGGHAFAIVGYLGRSRPEPWGRPGTRGLAISRTRTGHREDC